MGVCFSGLSRSSSRTMNVMGSATNPPMLQDPHPANGHVNHLSGLGRNRTAISGIETAASHRPRAAVPTSPQRQAAVTAVLKEVRDIYCKKSNLKSGNKVRGDGGPDELDRQEKATLEIERMRSEPDPLRAAMNGKAHQCQELALLAVYHAQERGLPAQILELGGDDVAVAHDVAVIGPIPDPLPPDMAAWPSDVYVCDPWSNIACKARDYPDRFSQKMEKWEQAGKLVGFPPKGFVFPTDPDWMGDVLHGNKSLNRPLEDQPG